MRDLIIVAFIFFLITPIYAIHDFGNDYVNPRYAIELNGEYSYNNFDDISKAERLKTKLENKGLKPEIELIGLNKLVISWEV